MKRLKSLLTICLALTLVAVVPLSLSWADGTVPGGSDDGNTDSGHPWDDETTVITFPDNQGSEQTAVRSDSRWSGHMASVPALSVGGSRWVEDAVSYLWQRIAARSIIAKLRAVRYWRIQ